MPREPLLILAPGHDSNDLTRQGSTSQNWSFPALSVAGAAPPASDRWVELDDGAGDSAIGPGDVFTPKDFIWLCVGGWRYEGNPSVSDDQRILYLGNMSIRWVYSDTNKYNLRVTDVSGGATGTTDYDSVDLTLAFRLEMNGTNWKLWVDGETEPEIVYASTYQPTTTSLLLDGTDVLAGDLHYLSGIYLCQSDSEADRPDHTNLVIHMAEANGQGFKDEYLDQDLNSADETHVQLVADAVDEATYWNGNPANTERQHALLANVTITNDLDGIMVRKAGYDSAAKTTDSDTEIVDTVSEAAASFANPDLQADIRGYHNIFKTDPNGNPWPDYDHDDLQVGIKHTDANGANDRWAAIVVEFADVATDAPPVVAPPVVVGQSIQRASQW